MKYIIIPLFVGVITQCIKFIIETIKTKKINILRLFDGMGGMPSTHSSLVSSLSTIIYLNYGINNPLTSIVIIFSLLIIYDSMGIRYESGNQARVINKVVGTNLKEKLGHNPLEVLAGVVLGITLGIVMNIIFT
jgi:acid phosphatase family membrane protein YuiD